LQKKQYLRRREPVVGRVRLTGFLGFATFLVLLGND
jgi:hypothetical protein